MGSEANQAIMLVTEGLPFPYWKYESVFWEYNEPHKPVRVFSYIVGNETSDLYTAEWLACNNKG